MQDSEVAACVAAATGRSPRGAQIEQLQGKQGLLICRVLFPNSGSFIFKVVPFTNRRELAVTSHLSAALPGRVPHVYASEEDRARNIYWLVTHDMGPRRLADDPSVECYIAVAKTLARIQIETLHETDTLHNMGVPMVGPNGWEEMALRVLENAGKSDSSLIWCRLDELERMIWTTSDITADTKALPMALIHGDLHAGNVAVQPENTESMCLLDWGSAYIGAALLGLEELLWPAAHHLRTAEGLNRVKAAYLREWAPILGKPSWLEKPTLASQVLVRLELLDESLGRQSREGCWDEYASAVALRNLLDAWRSWSRL